jgi:hypothetical protein
MHTKMVLLGYLSAMNSGIRIADCDKIEEKIGTVLALASS